MRGGRFTNFLVRFMAGRNGADALSRFLSLTGVVCIVLSMVTGGVGNGLLSRILSWLTFMLLGLCYWRVLSRNIYKRQAENRKYLELRSRVVSWWRLQKDRIKQRKEFRFYSCPGCRCNVRVPKGKGHIRITCRRCGYTFERKT